VEIFLIHFKKQGRENQTENMKNVTPIPTLYMQQS